MPKYHGITEFYSPHGAATILMKEQLAEGGGGGESKDFESNHWGTESKTVESTTKESTSSTTKRSSATCDTKEAKPRSSPRALLELTTGIQLPEQ